MTTHFIINGKNITFAQPTTLRINVPEPYILKREGELLTLIFATDAPVELPPKIELPTVPDRAPGIPMSWTMGWKKRDQERTAKALWIGYYARVHACPITREAWASYLAEPDRVPMAYVLDKLVKRKLLGVRGKGKRAIYSIPQ